MCKTCVVELSSVICEIWYVMVKDIFFGKYNGVGVSIRDVLTHAYDVERASGWISGLVTPLGEL